MFVPQGVEMPAITVPQWNFSLQARTIDGAFLLEEVHGASFHRQGARPREGAHGSVQIISA